MRTQTEAALTAGGQALVRLAVLCLTAAPGFLVPLAAGWLAGAAVVRVFRSTDSVVLLALVAGLLGTAVVAGRFVRRTASGTRRQVERWYGIRMPVAYGPRAELELDARGHWWTGYSYHRSQTVAKVVQLLHWAFRDKATRGEILWLFVNPAALFALAGPVAFLLLTGTYYLPIWSELIGRGRPSPDPGSMVMNLVVGLALIGAGVLLAPYAVRAYVTVARRVLDQDGRATHAQLTRRVAQLTETRADAVGDQAAELRRIERDLHDGAQARLVAIGMTLGTIEHLMETDQGAARTLLAEARQSSERALQELRDLVRGIHPPVLAERGLGDAVRSLALDCALPTEVFVDLPDRLPAPVEAAAYFSICELLANAAKHSEAEQVWVDILYRAGSLRVTVTDDGVGVADPSKGSGLRGIERRLGTFDGVLTIDSTSGGPTTITLELPCALSSPRTSTSSAKV
ncbi:sensor histidine kinase [Streptomyces sp. NRRL WC-3742]|uniref:sensor histidine kinase n=1 Tax=Streptomyces sp. NRRL WC-3742 TaxID=1463934 RepID=UPI00068FCA79|nr:sensor histidine kinase [Streptomyces sp. NRRL WC-3742]